MSYDSAPVEEKAPAFDEIVEYAVEHDLFGKISLTKFYDYYGDFKGHHGLIIDWRQKMQSWAQRQRSPIIVSAKESEARDRIIKQKAPKVPAAKNDIVSELWAKVATI